MMLAGLWGEGCYVLCRLVTPGRSGVTGTRMIRVAPCSHPSNARISPLCSDPAGDGCCARRFRGGVGTGNVPAPYGRSSTACGASNRELDEAAEQAKKDMACDAGEELDKHPGHLEVDQ